MSAIITCPNCGSTMNSGDPCPECEHHDDFAGCDCATCILEREPLDDEIITCWCGATGTHDELFDSEVYSRTCGGTGSLDCECGGDQCVCHHHGEVECPGCSDCDDSDGFDEGDDYDYDSEM